MGRKKGSSIGPKVNLTGNVYGKLTVTAFAGKQYYPSGESKYTWKCQCECGNEIVTTGNALRTGNTSSCRQCIYIDITNQRFGKLVALERQTYRDEDGKAKAKWKCICDCGNTHYVSYGNLFHKNVVSCGCRFFEIQEQDFERRKSELLGRIREAHGDRYQYNLDSFVNVSSKIKIFCEEHGEFSQRVADHVFGGTGCRECFFDSRRLGVDGFKEASTKVHGTKYDYSLITEYHRNSDIVEIVCPEHGKFSQSAHSHLAGSGCPSCSSDLRRWGYRNYCLSNEEFGQATGSVYLLELTNKEGDRFLKVGVSRSIGNRLSVYRRDGLEPKLLTLIGSITALKSAEIEIKILRDIKKKQLRHIPRIKFAGWTECAKIEAKEYLISVFEEVRRSVS